MKKAAHAFVKNVLYPITIASMVLWSLGPAALPVHAAITTLTATASASTAQTIGPSSPPTPFFGFNAVGNAGENLSTVSVAINSSAGFTMGDLATLGTGASSGIALYRDDGTTQGSFDSADANITLGLAPVITDGSIRFSKLIPTSPRDTSDSSQAIIAGDLMLADTTAGGAPTSGYSWHIVTTGATGVNSASLRLDGAAAQPTYRTGSTRASLFTPAATATSFIVSGTSAISPTGSYSAPAVGDIIYYQTGTAPGQWGLVTNATLTSGTFAIDGTALAAATYRISKVAGQTGSFVVPGSGAIPAPGSGYTSPAVGDIVLYRSAGVSSWGIVTNATMTTGTFAINGAPLSPSTTYQISKVTAYTPSTALPSAIPTGASAVQFGDAVFGMPTSNPVSTSFGWHISSGDTTAAGTDLRLDSRASAPLFGFSALIVVGGTEPLPADDMGNNAGADYYVVLRTSSGAVNNHAFTVALAPPSVGFSAGAAMLAAEVVSPTYTIATTAQQSQSAGANTTAVDLTNGFLRLKQSSDFKAVARVQFGSNENTKTLTSIAVSFATAEGTIPTWTSSAATSSELLNLATTNGGITLWKDGGSPGFGLNGAGDTQVTLAASPVYGASNTFTITPASPPTIASDDVYFVVLKSNTSGVTNGNAFTVSMAANAITTSGTSPTIQPMQTPSIRMDTVAPTISAVTGFAGQSTLTVKFSEPVQRINAGGSITTADLTYTNDATNGSGRTVSTITHNPGQDFATLTMSGALAAGDFDGSPSTLAAGSNKIEDMAGNVLGTTAANLSSPLTITTATIPATFVGATSDATTPLVTFVAAGGTSPYTFAPNNATATVDTDALTALGLTLATNGKLTGTIAAGTAGSKTVAIKVTDSTGGTPLTSTKQFTINVAASQGAGIPGISSVTPPGGAVGASNVSVTITGTNTHFSSSSTVSVVLPPGAGGTNGVTAGMVTFNSATSITVPLTISGTASSGSRDVVVTTSTENVSLPNGFGVTTAVAAGLNLVFPTDNATNVQLPQPGFNFNPSTNTTFTNYRISVSSAQDFSSLVWDYAFPKPADSGNTNGSHCTTSACNLMYGEGKWLPLTPPTSLAPNTKYFWRVQTYKGTLASADVTNALNKIEDTPARNFTTVTSITDTIPPQIIHRPVYEARANAALTLYARVNDNIAKTTTTPALGASIFACSGSACSLPATATAAGVSLGSNYFSFTIPSGTIGASAGTIIRYYISATDGTNTGFVVEQPQGTVRNSSNPFQFTTTAAPGSPATIAGTVKDLTNTCSSAVQGATVFADGTGFATTTASDCTFTLSGLSTGSPYNLVAVKDGFSEGRQDGVNSGATGRAFMLGQGAVGGFGGDTTRPHVKFSMPGDKMQNLPGGNSNMKILVIFDKAMSQTSVTTSGNITVNELNVQTGALTNITTTKGAWTYNSTFPMPFGGTESNVAAWSLSTGQTLGDNKTIAVKVTPSVTDTAGNAVQGNVSDGSYAFSFSTGGTANFTGGTTSGGTFTFASGEKFGEGGSIPPHVMGTSPFPGAFAVPTNSTMSITFDQTMADDASGYTLLSNIKLFQASCTNAGAGNDVTATALNAATLTSNKMTATVTLKSGFNSGLFLASTQYCLQVLGGAKGAAGMTMSPPGQETQVRFFADFKTSTGTDTTAPTVTGSFPDNAAASVPLPLGSVSISFSKDMDPATITTSTLTVTTGSSSANGTVEYRPGERTAFFYPTQSLTPSTTYTLTLTTAVKAMNGVALASTQARTFTTGTADTTAPVIVSMNADDTNVAITFSKPMNAAPATDDQNFSTSVLKSGNYTSIKYGTAGFDPSSAGTSLTLPTSASFTWDARSNTVKIKGYRPSGTTPTMLRGNQLYVSVASTVTDLGGTAISTTGNANTSFATIQDSNATKGVVGGMTITDDLAKQIGAFQPMNFSSTTFGFVPKVDARPFNTMAGVTTNYGIRLPISKQIPDGGKIVLTFPEGFDVSGAQQDVNSPKRRDINNKNTGTITFKCQTNSTAFNGKSCGGGAANSDENSSSGTGTVSSTGTTVTGTGTAFATQLIVGGTITAGGQTRTITAIASASSLTTDTAFSPVISGGTSFTYTNDDGVVVNTLARTVTVYVSGATQSEGHDFLDFDLAGIKNSTIPKDFNTSGYSIDIKTKAASTTATLESLSSMPFFIQSAGSTTVSGTITLGTASTGTMDVFLDSPMTGSLKATSADFGGGTTAAYSFTNVPNGDYGLRTDSYVTIGSNSYVGKFPPERITVSGNTTKNFTLANAATGGTTLTVRADSGTTSQSIDIYASSPTAGFRVIQKTLDATAGFESFTIVLLDGQWNVGVGPQMPKGIMSGPPPAPSYLVPRPVNVVVTNPNCTIAGTVSTNCAATVDFTLTSSTKTIQGLVQDTSGKVMADVDVHAFDTKAGVGTFARTDTTGTFSLPVTTGLYNVGVFVPGMPPTGDTPVEVTSDATTYLKIKGAAAITPATAATTFIIKMSKADFTISGKVTDGTNVIQGASVMAYQQNAPGNVFAQTDSKGQYTLYVSAGTWVVQAFLPAYGNLTQKSVTITTANATDINFAPSSTGTFNTVTGTVTVGGTPQQGAQVRIRNTTYFNQIFTASDGTYTFNVPQGTGYIIDGFVPGVGELAPLAAFDVTANVTGKDLTVATLRTITLTFTSTVTRAFVQLQSTTTKARIGKEVKNAASDTLTVPDGSYLVTIDLQGAQIAKTALAVTSGTATYSTTTGVMTGVAGNVGLTVTIPTLRTLTITVQDSSAGALSNAWVDLNNPKTGEHFGDKTNSSGQVILQAADSPAGQPYFINAMKPGFFRTPTSLTVTVDAASTLTMTAATKTISGQVKIGTAGVQNAFVRADKQGGGFTGTQTDASGNYTLSVTEGLWIVAARTDGYAEVALAAPVDVTTASATGKDITLVTTVTINAPKSQSITPANGGTLQDDANGIKMVIPGNALGSSSSSGNIQAKKTTNIVTTDSGRPIAGLEITATDSNGTAIKQLSDNVTIELTYTVAELAAQKSATDSSINTKTEVDLMLIGFWDDSIQNWSTLSTTVTYLDSSGGVVTSPSEDLSNVTTVKLTALTNHFSLFAPLVSTDPSAPLTPSGFVTGTSTTSTINLQWNAVTSSPAATGYDIYRSTSSSGTFSRIGSEPTVSSGMTTSYQDTGLDAGITYYYKITAVNNNGESAPSSAISGATSSATSSSSSSGGIVSSSSSSSTTTSTTTATKKEEKKTETPGADLVWGFKDGKLQQITKAEAAAIEKAEEKTKSEAAKSTEKTSEKKGAMPAQTALPGAQSVLSVTPPATATKAERVSFGADQLAKVVTGKDVMKLPEIKRAFAASSHGGDVKTLQYVLQSEGLYKGKITGAMNKETTEAIKKFQIANKLATAKTVGFGTVGPTTRTFINSILKEAKADITSKKEAPKALPKKETKPAAKQEPLKKEEPKTATSTQKEVKKIESAVPMKPTGEGGGESAVDKLKRLMKK